jgi:hypothetical protein
VPGAKRRKKLAVEMHGLQPQAARRGVKAGHKIKKIVAAFEAGRADAG